MATCLSAIPIPSTANKGESNQKDIQAYTDKFNKSNFEPPGFSLGTGGISRHPSSTYAYEPDDVRFLNPGGHRRGGNHDDAALKGLKLHNF
jgi:hypothetical protein